MKTDGNRWKDDLGLEESILSKGKVQKKKKKAMYRCKAIPIKLPMTFF